MMDAHSLETEEVLKRLKTDKNGLREEEAKERLLIYGKNKIRKQGLRTPIQILIDQFRNWILWLLLAAAVVSYAIGNVIDAGAILLAVVLSVVFGFYLENKADRSMEALRKMISEKAVVIREGKINEIDAEDLVPGDIIILEEGMRIPADGRIIESSELKIDESLLTGEAEEVKKDETPVRKNTPLAERKSMVYKGTLVVQGRGLAVVVSTGEKTEFGKIAKKMGEIKKEETTLQKSLNDLGKKLSIGSVIVILILIGIGILHGRTWVELFVLAVSLAVAAIPEGLITVLTIILSLGVKEMAEHKAIVRKIAIVETIGAITTICTDKTGTITEGKLKFEKVFVDKKILHIKEAPKKIIEYSILCNTAAPTEKGFVGDPLDKAILEEGSKIVDISELKKRRPKKIEPLTSERKYMSVLFNTNGKKLLIMKGAPEVILNFGGFIEEKGEIRRIKSTDIKEIENALDTFAKEGMRVVAISYKEGDDEKKDMVFLGLLAFRDPPRKEAKETIETAKEAGIDVIMITGDNKKTAKTIGEAISLKGDVVEWEEIKEKSKEQLYAILKKAKIIARATPMSKLKIVEALIDKGEVVAVTGDGVNDAPALKRAHVGVVMGEKGTEVSKEAGDLILLDDNLATLVKAIEYGRNIYKRILSFVRFQLTTSISALLIFFISFLSNLPNPLTAIQVLFVNIIMDGPPALALGMEKSTKEVMKEKPKKTREIISKKVALKIAIYSVFIGLVTLGIFIHYLKNSPEKALTASFTVFVFMQLFNSLNCRSTTKPFYQSINKNKPLLLIILLMAVLQWITIYIEPIQLVFKTKPLEVNEYLTLIGLSASILAFGEIEKRILNKKEKG